MYSKRLCDIPELYFFCIIDIQIKFDFINDRTFSPIALLEVDIVKQHCHDLEQNSICLEVSARGNSLQRNNFKNTLFIFLIVQSMDDVDIIG